MTKEEKSIYNKQYRLKNKEKEQTRMLKWYNDNKEKFKEYNKEYYQKNKEHLKELRRLQNQNQKQMDGFLTKNNEDEIIKENEKNI